MSAQASRRSKKAKKRQGVEGWRKGEGRGRGGSRRKKGRAAVSLQPSVSILLPLLFKLRQKISSVFVYSIHSTYALFRPQNIPPPVNTECLHPKLDVNVIHISSYSLSI